MGIILFSLTVELIDYLRNMHRIFNRVVKREFQRRYSADIHTLSKLTGNKALGTVELRNGFLSDIIGLIVHADLDLCKL